MSLPTANSALLSLGLAGLDKGGALGLPGVWSVSGPGGVEVRSVPQALGLPVCPLEPLEHGAGSCWGCGVGGCSPFWVSPKGREPQEFLNLGVGGLPAAWEEAGIAKAAGSAHWQGLGCWIGGPRLGGTQLWFKPLWRGLGNPLSVFSSFVLRPAS